MRNQFIQVGNPLAQFAAHEGKIREAMERVLKSGRYILGPEAAAFEEEFAAFVGARFAVGVASGTDALTLALKAVGIGAGDEVITVSNSAVATVAAIELTGAVPVFVDIDPQTRCMDPARIPAMVSDRTRGIVPVHIYGQPAPMAEILAIAAQYDLKVVEDCAQAHGAEIQGRKVGTFGNAAAFSFYPTKNLGALGDGGAVTTDDPVVAARLRSQREYGWQERYVSHETGGNSRLDELQSAILRVKLRHLPQANDLRRGIAAQYSLAADGKVVHPPATIAGTLHAMHLYVVECAEREALQAFLQEKGIGSARHYPLAIHQQPAYQRRIRGWDNLPATEALYRRILTLPLYPELPAESVDRVCRALNEWITQQSP